VTTIQLHHFTILAPERHWLGPIRQDCPDYSENIGRMSGAVERKYPNRGVIDIVANVGDTAEIVQSHSSLPILCIEGSAYYFEFLEKNAVQLGPSVEWDRTFVGATDSTECGTITIERGTAFFRPSTGEVDFIPFQKLESILARHPRFRDAKVLKVDTDGMDGLILIGALNWIASAKPALFWEHDMGLDRAVGGPGLRIFARLNEVGYTKAVIFDNRGKYIQTLSLSARQQLADLSDYLPGGDEFYGYCDVCAFHETDLDLCDSVRRIELETRAARRESKRRL
jgi:hypothetical protein